MPREMIVAPAELYAKQGNRIRLTLISSRFVPSVRVIYALLPIEMRQFFRYYTDIVI